MHGLASIHAQHKGEHQDLNGFLRRTEPVEYFRSMEEEQKASTP